MTFQVPVHISEDLSLPETEAIRDEQITVMEADGCVSGQPGCVSKPRKKCTNFPFLDTKHGRQVAAQIDDAAVPSGEGYQ